MKTKNYVYRHRRNDTNEVFYIGIGKYSRYCSKKDRNQYWTNIVNKVGFTPEIIANNLTREEAAELEIFLIELYGRKDKGLGLLVNMTNGGDAGFEMSDETKEKIRQTKLGYKNPNYNKPLTDEAKLHLSKLNSGSGNAFFGKKHSEETKEKLRNPKSEETKEKLRIAMCVKIDEEIKNNIINDFNNKINQSQLCKKYNLGRKVIARIIKQK
jgi:hypothetical protein